MDSELKKEVIASTVPSIIVPLLRAGVSHHFTMKQLEKQQEMEVEVAERRQQGVRAMARQKRGGVGPATQTGTVRRSEPIGGGTEGDVYDELEALKGETNCEFCHAVIDSLMDAPTDEARQGLDELRSYVREVERIENRDLTEDEAEQIVSDLVDRWRVVPKHTAGIA